MFTIMFTLILAEWQARAVESLITYNYTCTVTLSGGVEFCREILKLNATNFSGTVYPYIDYL